MQDLVGSSPSKCLCIPATEATHSYIWSPNCPPPPLCRAPLYQNFLLSHCTCSLTLINLIHYNQIQLYCGGLTPVWRGGAHVSSSIYSTWAVASKHACVSTCEHVHRWAHKLECNRVLLCNVRAVNYKVTCKQPEYGLHVRISLCPYKCNGCQKITTNRFQKVQCDE